MNAPEIETASDTLCAALAAKRGIDEAMFRCLRDQQLLLAHRGLPAFPVRSPAGVLIGAHVQWPAGNGGPAWSRQ